MGPLQQLYWRGHRLRRGSGARSLLLVGHLGKLVKVAGGAMNTHSKTADGRRETLAAHTALCGGSRALVESIFTAPISMISNGIRRMEFAFPSGL